MLLCLGETMPPVNKRSISVLNVYPRRVLSEWVFRAFAKGKALMYFANQYAAFAAVHDRSASARVARRLLGLALHPVHKLGTGEKGHDDDYRQIPSVNVFHGGTFQLLLALGHLLAYRYHSTSIRAFAISTCEAVYPAPSVHRRG